MSLEIPPTIRILAALVLAMAMASCDSGTATTATAGDTSTSDTTPDSDATAKSDTAVADTAAGDTTAGDASSSDSPGGDGTASDAANPDASTDAKTGALGWTVVNSATTQSINGIAWSGKRFVASLSTSVLTSDDAATWTEQKTSGSMNWLGAVAASPTMFAMVGGWGGDTGIFTSPDGITWTDHFALGSGKNTGIVWADSQFVAAGPSTPTSPDGLKWTPHGATGFRAIAWNGKFFVGVGASCGVGTSPDAVTWTNTQCLPSRTNTLTAVVWTGSQFVAVGGKGIAITSVDGVKWEDRTWDTKCEFAGVASNAAGFVIVGQHTYPDLSSCLMTLSADGKNWAKADGIPGQGLNAIIWTGKQFVAVGNGGVILTSN
ncbi:MAG: hypothetical protein HY902_12325 [Deltaproteobacteria bacterium]|nr:hypothetical protein [Deltaproteobacteria bacterium]